MSQTANFHNDHCGKGQGITVSSSNWSVTTGSSKLETILFLSILKSQHASYKSKYFWETYLAFSNKNAHTNCKYAYVTESKLTKSSLAT